MKTLGRRKPIKICIQAKQIPTYWLLVDSKATKDLAEQNVISSRIFKRHKGHAAISLCSDQNWFALDPFTNTNVVFQVFETLKKWEHYMIGKECVLYIYSIMR